MQATDRDIFICTAQFISDGEVIDGLVERLTYDQVYLWADYCRQTAEAEAWELEIEVTFNGSPINPFTMGDLNPNPIDLDWVAPGHNDKRYRVVSL